MVAQTGPFGFQPVKHPSGIIRPAAAVPNGIASTYGTTIYSGAPVILDTNGTLIIGTGGADLYGIFAGCQFTPSDGSAPRWSPIWPAGQTYMNDGSMVAYVNRFDDPLTFYRVQSTTALASTAVGDQADVINPGSGSLVTGLSSAALDALVGVGVQGQFRIMELSLEADNAWGDPVVNVLVQVARSQFVANKVAI